MASPSWGLFFILSLSLLLSPANSLPCSSTKFSNNNLYSHCSDLPYLSASLHSTFDSSNSSLSVAFVADHSNAAGWIAWAVNPTSTGMAGSQALVAYLDAGVPVVKTYDVASYGSVKPSELSFEVWDVAGELSGGELIIFAKLKVPVGDTTLNQVWQVGPSVDGTRLGVHEFKPENLKAKGTLSLSGGESTSTASGGGEIDPRMMRKNIHGVLNAVSWGLLFPIGIVIARYLRVFPSADPAWFYLHISCQISAYVIGVAGWGTGMKLGSESEGYQVFDHRNIGIALFSMATLQVLLLPFSFSVPFRHFLLAFHFTPQNLLQQPGGGSPTNWHFLLILCQSSGVLRIQPVEWEVGEAAKFLTLLCTLYPNFEIAGRSNFLP